MILQDLGNLGEFIGSIAVVIILIYVARQIRQSSEVSQTEGLNKALEVHQKKNDYRRTALAF
jgi:uncharacterized membrane protein